MTLSDKQKAELEALNNLADEEIDLSDAPEVTDWSNAFRGYHRLHAGLGPPKAPDITEKGLESLITNSLVNQGWIQGTSEEFDRTYCVDLNQLTDFLNATQPDTASALSLDEDTPTRRQFLNRLKEQVSARGIIEVLRNGIGHQQHQVSLFYGTPTPGNTDAEARYLQNRFSVTRQLRYSNDAKLKSLDLGLFINGLPIATMELKNRFTGQTIANAVTSTSRTATPGTTSSGSAAAPSTSRWTMRRSSSAPNSRGRTPSSCPSTREGTAEPATRSTHRHQDRLPVGTDTYPGRVDRHPGELRPESRQHPDMAQIPPTGGGQEDPGRCPARGRRATLPHPALRRQRQVQLHRLAGATADRYHQRQQTRLRLHNHHHRPPCPGHPDKQDHQAIHPGSTPPWATPRIPETCAGSLPRARRSSSPPSRSFPSYWTT